MIYWSLSNPSTNPTSDNRIPTFFPASSFFSAATAFALLHPMIWFLQVKLCLDLGCSTHNHVTRVWSFLKDVDNLPAFLPVLLPVYFGSVQRLEPYCWTWGQSLGFCYLDISPPCQFSPRFWSIAHSDFPDLCCFSVNPEIADSSLGCSLLVPTNNCLVSFAHRF